MSQETATADYMPGHHWVSPANYDTRVQESFDFPSPLTIYDSTLRKILYTPGLRVTSDDLLRVANALDWARVPEVLFNVHWWGDPEPEVLEYETCKALLKESFDFGITVSPDIIRSVYPRERTGKPARDAIDRLATIGVTKLSLAEGDPKDSDARKRQLEHVADILQYAKDQGLSCALSILDMGRRDIAYAIELAGWGLSQGAASLNLVDSFSALSPEAMKLLVQEYRTSLPTETSVSVHAHNDFGVGTSLALAAATAGAHPDVSVNSVSYRAGFASLDEVVLSLELLYGVKTGIPLENLKQLSDEVSSIIGMPSHPLKPVTGRNAYIRDLPDLMIQYLERGAEGFPPVASCYVPSIVGATMELRWGAHISDAVIDAKARSIGLALEEAERLAVRKRISSKLEGLRTGPFWLTDPEVEEFIRDIATKPDS